MKFCYLLLLIIQCASNVKTTSETSVTGKNNWIINRPESVTHFIGTGSAKISADMGEVQKKARYNALQDISEQIKVQIISGTVLSEITIEINKEYFDSSSYTQNIRTYSDAIFEGVETVETDTSDGYYWVQIRLDKSKYFANVNEKINNARQIAIDALIAADKSDPVKRVYELVSALRSINDFRGSLLKCNLNGTEIILNTEILRRVRQTLSDFTLRASVEVFEAGSLEPIPDSIGFYVTYQNTPVDNCHLRWSVSNSDVTLLSLSGRIPGFYPVQISSLSSSAGRVIVTASIDFTPVGNDLKKTGIKAPESKLIVSRKKPSIFLKGKNEFTESLIGELTGRNIFSLTDSEDKADYSLRGTLEIDSNVTIQRNIFQAKGVLDYSITRMGDVAPTGLRKNITIGNGKSADAALRGLKKEAIAIAIQNILTLF